MWDEIARMAAVEEHVTVLLTTHYLDEADRLSDRLAIVDHGRIVVEGTPDELKSQLRGDSVVVELADATTGSVAAQRLAACVPRRRRAEGAGSVRAARSEASAVQPAGGPRAGRGAGRLGHGGPPDARRRLPPPSGTFEEVGMTARHPLRLLARRRSAPSCASRHSCSSP